MALKFKVGDTVRIVNNIHGHGFEIDEEVLIEDIREDERDEFYLAVRLNGGEDEWWHVFDSEIEPTGKE